MANIEDLILRDTRANQPAAGIPGRLYYVTDEGVTERDNGSSWEDWSDAGSLGGSTGSTDNAVIRADGTGGALIQSSPVLIDDDGAMYGFSGKINAQTGTTYTTQDSDNGKVVTLSNASPITLTVHQDAAAGFNCLIIQLGAGQVTVAAGGTGNVRNYDGHSKLAGQYAMGSIFVVSNAGTAPEVYLAGNTGA